MHFQSIAQLAHNLCDVWAICRSVIVIIQYLIQPQEFLEGHRLFTIVLFRLFRLLTEQSTLLGLWLRDRFLFFVHVFFILPQSR